MAAITETAVRVVLERDKETKRTVRYAEQSDNPRVGMVYVPNGTVAELGNPAAIEITLTRAA